MAATASVSTLVLIASAAVLAPILSELSGPVAVGEIVIRIGFGILVGPYVFDLAHLNTLVIALSDLGLTYLIFLTGFELDRQRIRGTPLRLAFAGWGPRPWARRAARRLRRPASWSVISLPGPRSPGSAPSSRPSASGSSSRSSSW